MSIAAVAHGVIAAAAAALHSVAAVCSAFLSAHGQYRPRIGAKSFFDDGPARTMKCLPPRSIDPSGGAMGDDMIAM